MEFSQETSREALIREVKEEIDVTIDAFHNTGKVRFLFPHKPKWNQDVDIFIVKTWTGIPKETEVIQPMWFNINTLPFSQMWNDAPYWIPLLLEGKVISATFLYGEGNMTVVDKDIEIKSK